MVLIEKKGNFIGQANHILTKYGKCTALWNVKW